MANHRQINFPSKHKQEPRRPRCSSSFASLRELCAFAVNQIANHRSCQRPGPQPILIRQIYNPLLPFVHVLKGGGEFSRLELIEIVSDGVTVEIEALGNEAGLCAPVWLFRELVVGGFRAFFEGVE